MKLTQKVTLDCFRFLFQGAGNVRYHQKPLLSSIPYEVAFGLSVSGKECVNETATDSTVLEPTTALPSEMRPHYDPHSITSALT